MRFSLQCRKLFLVFLLAHVGGIGFAQTSYEIVHDFYNDYSVSAPPNKAIVYVFTSSKAPSGVGCKYNWTAVNSANIPPGLTLSSGESITQAIMWNNTNGNASATATSYGCTDSGNDGATATYSVPIRYLGSVVGIVPSQGNPLSCGSQTVTFTAGAATNATSYQWDYSSLPGWSYVSGQGTRGLTMTSSVNTGGSVRVTAKRSDAPDVSTSSGYTVARPTQPTLAIDGPATFCLGSSTSFAAANFLAGSTFSWAVSSNLQIVSGDGTGQIYVQGQTAGSGQITLTVTNDCGTVSKTINVSTGATVGGTFISNTTTYNVYPTNGVTVFNNTPTCYISLNSPFDPSATYSWQITLQSNTGTSFNSSNGGSNASIYCAAGKELRATCTVNTPCGSTQVSFNVYNASSAGFRMMAYPNPASQDINIVVEKTDESPNGEVSKGDMTANSANAASSTSDTAPQQGQLAEIDDNVSLFNKNSLSVYEGKLTKGKLNFSVVGLPDGIYYLQFNHEDKRVRQQIIVQH